jgi:hypothetical protein
VGARARLAAAAPSCAGLPQLLSAKNCADMRKAHMLHMAHAWRYKSDCWSAKAPAAAGADVAEAHTASSAAEAPPAGRKRGRAAGADAEAATQPPPARCSARRGRAAPQRCAPPPAPPALPQALPLLLLQDRTFTTLGCARASALRRVAPFVAQACVGWEAHASAAAFGAAGGAGMTWARLRSVEGAIDVSATFTAVLDARLGALHAWRDTLDEATQRAPAYALDATFATPDSELDALRCALRCAP